MQQWQNFLRPGAAAVSLMRPDNAPHHSGPAGAVISALQSLDPTLDHKATHIAIVCGVSDKPTEPGETPVEIVDTLDGKTVALRQLERNYCTEFYNIVEDVVLQENPRVLSQDLGKKAVEVAHQFIGIPYARSKLLSLIIFRNYRENIPVDDAYIKDLLKRFPVDTQNGRFFSDNANETFVCPELFVICYQIAWLLLAGPKGARAPLPEWVNIRSGVSTANLVKFLRENPFFEPVPAEIGHQIRYSGKPHPNDPPKPEKPEPLGYSTVRFSVDKYLQKPTSETAESLPKAKL